MTTNSVEWERKTTTFTVRWNGKCRRCKAHHTALVTTTVTRTYRSDRIGEVSRVAKSDQQAVVCCGKYVTMKPVKGRVCEDIPCGPKCLSATGHICECACGGKNHGAGAAAREAA